ncbi:MAG: hypothetical protein ACTSP5_16295 [Candidatus Heimdallarchaeota archaeon]
MPKKKKTIKEAPDTNILAEPEDFDMPLTDDEDECPEILENIEPEEAIGTIFRNIHVSTLVTFALGIIFGIFYYIADKGFPEVFPGWSRVLIGFAAGLLVIFGASELIIQKIKQI